MDWFMDRFLYFFSALFIGLFAALGIGAWGGFIGSDPVSETLTVEVNEAIDCLERRECRIEHNEFRMLFFKGDDKILEIWVANYPYASSKKNGYRANFKTRRRVERLKCELSKYCDKPKWGRF